MSWKLIGKPSTYALNHKLAQEFAEMESVPRDRPLKETRLMVYSRLITDNQFGPVTWAKARCKETNCVYRVNGKHTSTLFSRMEPMPQLYVTVQSYECDTLDDVAKLYSTFDSKMQTRNANDIAMSFAGTVPELAILSRRLISHAVAGLAYREWQDESSGKQPQERAELLLEHSQFVVWLDEFFRGTAAYAHLDRAPVIAAMLGSYAKSQARSIQFWTTVRDETGESPNMPDRKLAKFLLTKSLSGTGTMPSRIVTRREMYVKCIHAWNAWKKGETTDLKYFAQARVPAFA